MHVAGQQLCDTNVAAMPRLRAAEGPAFAWPMRSMATPFVSIAPCRRSSKVAFSISTDAWSSDPSSTMMMRSGRTVWATHRRCALPPASGEVARYPRLTLMHVCGHGLGADFGGEVVGLNLPHRDAADLRIGEFHIRHMRLLRHQRLQAVAAFIQILDQ